MKRQRILFIVFILMVIALSEMIGFQSIELGSARIGLLPLIYAVLLTMFFGMKFLRKGFVRQVYTSDNVKFAANSLMFVMLPLMAYYGADVAPKLREIFQVGWVFILQEFGNVGTVLLGLPIALLLGLKRSSIGATLGLGREGELAYISEKYTLNSDEGRGVLSMYLIGTLFGAIFFSIFTPFLISLGFDYRALGMASGMGSASMMTAASASLASLMPTEEMAETVRSYAAASQLLTSFLGTYMMVFVAIPLQRFMYNLLAKGDSYDQLKGESKHV
ncbi:DUF3100 domain-containing protein [Dolosicoccus paucivorans]|uniref:DUF3100 domain-containing protein n=1 Tax=Dolosicoccus paucivorans TaxID=84521 RepID=A0A1G8L583_9LACT|nr:DUF3100 domain-containing protein [Dolosicoccus paucivorans]PMB84253.1 DUF3100 domain-containing protein [Dolosicoccus paucivorans]PMC58501.1 DUF3100 domain-containing protein [Dolosicoccus paucivorans]SDI50874.1 Protein of unknown function [Dolosicoccus paucivorans]